MFNLTNIKCPWSNAERSMLFFFFLLFIKWKLAWFLNFSIYYLNITSALMNWEWGKLWSTFNSIINRISRLPSTFVKRSSNLFLMEFILIWAIIKLFQFRILMPLSSSAQWWNVTKSLRNSQVKLLLLLGMLHEPGKGS